MQKRFSTRGRAALEVRLAAQEVRTGIFYVKTSTILEKFQTISEERKAIEAGFSSLSQQRKAELAEVISAGTFRHERLYLLLTRQLNIVGNLLASSFEDYLHTYWRLFGEKPSLDDVSGTM